jgi:AmiR/NasT family two-component response regulator
VPSRILIVEDERIVAAALQHQLEYDGYEVVGNVGRGETAVEIAVECRPDVVLMDINLAGEVDGIAASAEIRERVGAPVVFLTAYSDDATLQRAGATVPFSYLLKPVQERQLRPAIEMALYRHRLEREREDLLVQLQDAVADIERLRGFLPVCAWCRKVHTEDGYWQDLVGYLTDRFGAVVTHGICDECAARLEAAAKTETGPGGAPQD